MIEDVEQQNFGLHCEKVSHWFGETKVLLGCIYNVLRISITIQYILNRRYKIF